ncbi:hypothetical protein JCM8097_005801 [Rhodosporidiobolus ruineniae]
MYRNSPYDSPDPRGLSRKPGRSTLRVFSSRTRLHPVLLLPVFLAGAFLAPHINRHLLPAGVNEPRLPDPVYRPQDYAWKPTDVFAEPDAPPLVPDDDSAGKRRRLGARKGTKEEEEERVLARDEHGAGGDEWEWWDPSSGSSSDSAPLTGADLTSSLYLVHSGLLYYPSTPNTVPTLSGSATHFPPAVPPAVRVPPRPRMPDEGLTLPPRAPASWLAPGELFARAPGRRKHALDRDRLVDLHAPLPPAPPRRNVAQQQQQQAAAARRAGAGAAGGGAAGGKKKDRIERDKDGHVLGPNAAAMARAKREGRPFVPGDPAELVEQREELARKRKAEAARKKAAALPKNIAWARADAQPKVAIAPPPALEEDEDDDGGIWEAADDEELTDADYAALEAEVDADEDEDVAIDENDDVALLAAIRALSPAELAELSPNERALVKELEANEAALKRRKGQAGGGRKNWMENDLGAYREREKAREQAKERARPPPPKPVFNPMGGRGLKKRSFEVEEIVESVQDPDGVADDFATTASPAAEPASSSSASADSSSPPSPDAASPSSGNLTRRALADDLTDDPSSLSSKPAPADRLHPIAHLIARAEEEWDDMLRRQSQTLEQAVAEYQRRYGRKPPAGFDAWWRYAMENRVVLVDEYDQIHSDLEPFFSLPPSELRRRAQQLQTDSSLPWHAHSFGVEFRDGAVEMVQGSEGRGGSRLEDLLDILGEFSEMLPDLQVRFSEGDEPAVVISGEARERHLDYAKRGKLLGLSQSYEVAEPTGFTAWDALCPPNSTARRLAQALPVDAPSGNSLRSFVSIEHARAMDLCEHPEVRGLNGITASWTGPRPHVLYPLFSFSKTSVHADILVPNLSNEYYVEVGRDPTWEQKKKNKVLWRGDTTGAYYARGTGWRQTQRARLVDLANPPHTSPASTTLHIASRSSDDALRRLSAPAPAVAQHYLDVAFHGKPVQCSTKDKTCALLSHEFRFEQGGRVLNQDEENAYKYILDVDANYPSGKFKRMMGSRSCVFKSTIFPEWWSKRIMPWYHYVPIQSDYSDLVDAAAFFIGLPDGSNSHDQHAKRIGAQGKKWADEHFREADMAAYLFRLYLEYARLLHRDEDNLSSMDYNP